MKDETLLSRAMEETKIHFDRAQSDKKNIWNMLMRKRRRKREEKKKVLILNYSPVLVLGNKKTTEQETWGAGVLKNHLTLKMLIVEETQEQDTAAMYRSMEDTLGRRSSAVLVKGPKTTMLPSEGNRNDLALQRFVFVFCFSSRQMLRFDFNAFCVVLYSHAKS